MLPAQPGEETLVVGFSLFLFFYFTRNLSSCTMKFKSGAGLLRILIYGIKSWAFSKLQVSSGVLSQPCPKMTEVTTHLHRVAGTGFHLHNDVTK